MRNRATSMRAKDQSGPAIRFAAVTPDDTTALPGGVTRAVFVGVAGTLVVEDIYGGVVSIASTDSQYHPLRVAKVLATGTDAAGIVALY